MHSRREVRAEESVGEQSCCGRDEWENVSEWVWYRVRRFCERCWRRLGRRHGSSEERGLESCCGRGVVVECRVCLLGCGRGGLSMGGGGRLRVDLSREAPLCLCV